MSTPTNPHVRLASTEVAVLLGGRSSERAVSLKTGAAIAGALRDGADGRGPLRVLEVEIAASGEWLHAGERHSANELLARLPAATVFVLGLHGGEGENGTIQGLLAASRRVFTGSGVAASALCMNKSWTKHVLAASRVTVAPGLEIRPAPWRSERVASVDALEAWARSRGPSFAVKPNCGGSSVATFLVQRVEDLAAAVDRVLATGDHALVEQAITGTEATCGVLGNAHSRLRALMPVEIVPNPGRFFDYDEKYSADGAREFCPPRDISPRTCELVRELALRAHRAAGCDGYSRVDFMIPRDALGGEGEPIVLEINTLPGMTDRSLLPLAARAEGLSFRDLCLEILELALERAEPLTAFGAGGTR